MDLLTDAEHRAMELTAELVNLMCIEIIGRDASRSGDVAEFVGHVHAIQQQILSQAAGRAYPGRVPAPRPGTRRRLTASLPLAAGRCTALPPPRPDRGCGV